MACARPIPGVTYRPLAGVKRSIGIIRREARPMSPAVRALAEFLDEAVPSRLKKV